MTNKFEKYCVSQEEDFEPSSKNLVLKNLLGIKDQDKIEKLEWIKLKKAYEVLFTQFDKNKRITPSDICEAHKIWLGDIYPWAGHYRSVNMSKDGFPFANAKLIPDLMNKLEKNELRMYTPCNFKTI